MFIEITLRSGETRKIEVGDELVPLPQPLRDQVQWEEEIAADFPELYEDGEDWDEGDDGPDEPYVTV